jgi:hypothetical protein
MFVGIKPSHSCSPCIEIDGFVRYSTFGFTNYMGSSHLGLGPGMIVHKSMAVLNATDPAGDGTGTLFANIVTHSQGDWTPVHIVNGRRVMVAHINSEYTEWADPYVTIENGIECAIIHCNPGGRMNYWYDTMIEMADGTKGFAGINSRNGMWQVGGQSNMIIGGNSYVSFRNMITSWTVTDIALRDPFFQRWTGYCVSGVNLAPSIRNFGFGDIEPGGVGTGTGAKAFVMSRAAACSTAFIDGNGIVSTDGLKADALPAGPSLPRPFMSTLPDLAFDDDGPGTNMTGESGAAVYGAIEAAANAVIYLGPGTYDIPGTINQGTIYGAGRDKTILRFPDGSRCLEPGCRVYNLTVEGGTVGWAGTRKWNATDHDVMNVRFRGQSICGITLGNSQQNFIAFCDFEDGVNGITACDDGIPCGEQPPSPSMIDKLNVYGCTFKNMGSGVSLGIGNNGFTSYLGCRFENCDIGIKIWRTKTQDGKCEGHYVTACDFVECDRGVDIYGATTVHNCSITGTGGSTGIDGNDLRAVVSCDVSGPSTAVKAGDWCVVSDVMADGTIERSAGTWVGRSVFSNLDARDGAYYGIRDLSSYVTAEPYVPDQTPPSAPTNVEVTAVGDDNVVTWDPSEDPESGILQYVIVRDGSRADKRTNFNFIGAPHRNELPPEGPGIYRNKTVFVDEGAATDGEEHTYEVVAVNCARIRSDNKMDMIFMFPHNRFAKPRGEYDYKLNAETDSVEVPKGLPVIPGINRPFLAYRFPPQTSTHVARHGNERGGPRIAGPRTLVNHAAPVVVYDVMGRTVARLRASELATWRRGLRGSRLGSGVLLVRMPNGVVQTISARR